MRYLLAVVILFILDGAFVYISDMYIKNLLHEESYAYSLLVVVRSCLAFVFLTLHSLDLLYLLPLVHYYLYFLLKKYLSLFLMARSEERRVGKECSFRCVSYRYNNMSR